MTIPALSVWQPWASLISTGAKRYETRSWQTHYRGPLAIHASQINHRTAGELESLLATAEFQAGLKPIPHLGDKVHWAALSSGAIVAVCRLVCVRPAAEVAQEIRGTEWYFGDFSAGRWAWQLEDVRRLEYPVTCRGHQRLFPVEIPS